MEVSPTPECAGAIRGDHRRVSVCDGVRVDEKWARWTLFGKQPSRKSHAVGASCPRPLLLACDSSF